MTTAEALKTSVDSASVQSHVIRSMNPDVAIFIFFHIVDVVAFRALLASLLPEAPAGPDSVPLHAQLIQSLCAQGPLSDFSMEPEGLRIWSEKHQSGDGTSREPKALSSLVAFTWTGLEKLEVDANTLQSFPQDFREGMAARAALLGDMGDTAPENWEGWLGNRRVHGVLQINFRRRPKGGGGTDDDKSRDGQAYDALAQQLATLVGRIEWKRLGLEILQVELGWSNYKTDPGGYRYRVEHFGNADGIRQPFADAGLGAPPPGGGTARPYNTWDTVAPGELLLGYPDEDGIRQTRPGNEKLRLGGTYMVLRKLEQDVVGFRQFVAQNGGASPERLAAQMVGAWRNGTPLVKSPLGPRRYSPQTARREINDFRYQAEDPDGKRCPIGAHIRRANPRDTNNRDTRRHRLFRRGISYGGPLLGECSEEDGRRRGLLFVALNARTDLQFEFVQTKWLNSGELAGEAGAGRCPLVGNNGGGVPDQFLSPDRPAPIFMLPRFVTLRGGDYFFVPPLPALDALAKAQKFPLDDGEEQKAAACADAITGTSKGTYANPSLAPTPTLFDPDRLFLLGRRELLPRESRPFIEWKLPFIPYGKPVGIKRVALVGRYEPVIRVLHDTKNFSAGLYADAIAGITAGKNMVLGMDGGAERALRLKIWGDAQQMLEPDPAKRGTIIETIVEKTLDKILARFAPAGKLDVATDIGRIIPLVLAQRYYGVQRNYGGPGPDWISPTYLATLFNEFEITSVAPDWLEKLPNVPPQDVPFVALMAWTRFAFLEVFLNLVVAAHEVTQAAKRSTPELFRYIDDVIFQAHRLSPRADSLLACMISKGGAAYSLSGKKLTYEQFDEQVKLLLAEMIIGSTETLNRGIVNVVNYLLDHPQLLTQAQAAARGGDNSVLSAIIRECLRFDPVAPALFRFCKNDVAFAADSGPPQVMKAGTIVCLLLKTAMFDDRELAFTNPDDFSTTRPADKYLHFSAGLHACKGQDISEVVLGAVLTALLKLDGLRRAAGPAGIRQQPLLLPDSLLVRFQPPC